MIGRVLKVLDISRSFEASYGHLIQDEDLLSVYKIQTNHTIHMVKGVARSSGTSSSSSATAALQQLPTMQTGQNVHDPLTQLNSHQGFGVMAGLNPFGEMGVNPNDPNMVCSFLCPCVSDLMYYYRGMPFRCNLCSIRLNSCNKCPP